MFCYRCGSSMPDNASVCPQCGAAVQDAPQPSSPPPAASTPTPPVSQPAPYQPGRAPGQPVPYGQPQESEGKATASLVLGILSIACFGFFTGIPAVILGHIAKSNIRKSGGRLGGDGKATAGLIMGYISIVLVPLILIIAAIAIPNLVHARVAANESAAASTIRVVSTAQITYLSAYPNAGYARDLATLGPGSVGACQGETQEHACLLDSRVGNPSCTEGDWCVKSGYQFSMAGSDCEGHPCADYVVVAKPVQTGTTGDKVFCSTNDAVIRQRRGTVVSVPTADECRSWSPIY